MRPVTQERQSREAVTLKIALSGFVLVLAGLLAAGAGDIARWIYPPSIVLLGVWFFIVQRKFYFDLVLWCWFLSPFLRRIMDYEAGWKDPSFILLTPFLVTMVAPLVDAPKIVKGSLRDIAPFVLAFLAIACGVVFGLFQGSVSAMATPLVDWSVPVFFAWWLRTTKEEDRANALSSLERSFFAGILVMGIYGVIQYVLAPPWDTNWLVQLSANADVQSMGNPEPFGLRVFSTLNSSAVFALIMAGGLLILVESRRKLAWVAAVFGSISLLLTLGRSAWLTLAIGLVALLFLMPRQVLRAIAVPGIAVFIAFSAFSVASLGPAHEMIGDRFSTFNRLQDDNSAGARLTGAIQAGQLLMSQPEGYGLGVRQDFIATDGSFSLNDNGLVNGFMALGLLPGLLYFGCLAVLLVQSCRGLRQKPPMVRIVAVTAVAFATQLPLDNINLGPTGVLLWMFAALASKEEYSFFPYEDLVGSSAPPPIVATGSPRITATGRSLLN